MLDSSLLPMSGVGFIAVEDPQCLSAPDTMETDLVTDGLVYRYDPDASPDGLRGAEGTFSLCPFALVETLTGERIGNFPQASTRLELIDAALTLDAALAGRAVRTTDPSGVATAEAEW